MFGRNIFLTQKVEAASAEKELCRQETKIVPQRNKWWQFSLKDGSNDGGGEINSGWDDRHVNEDDQMC